MSTISGILQMVIRVPGWLFFQEPIAQLTERLNEQCTPTSRRWRWWQGWQRKDGTIMPFSLQTSAVGKYRWLSWLSGSERTLLSFVGLTCFANYSINVRNFSRCIHLHPFPAGPPRRKLFWNFSLGAQTSVAQNEQQHLLRYTLWLEFHVRWLLWSVFAFYPLQH